MTLALPGLPDLGPAELIIIVLVILLLFGGRKLPEMARGTGRALRIFKAETKGLMTDDDDDEKRPAAQQAQLPQQGPVVQPAQPVQPVVPPVEQQQAQASSDQPRTDS